MTALIDEPVITPDDLLEMNGDKLYELVDGRLVEKDMGYWANRVAFVLGWYLETFLRQNKMGIANVEGSYECAPWSKIKVRIPDVSVVLAGRFPNNKMPVGHSTIAPDIAVEVISPSDRVLDLDRKVQDYFAAGVKEVWQVNPDMKTIRIKKRNGAPIELEENDILKSDDLLPGFALKVAEIFQ